MFHITGKNKTRVFVIFFLISNVFPPICTMGLEALHHVMNIFSLSFFFFSFKVLQVSFGQLLPAMPPKTSSSWAILCLQQALGSSGGTSLAEMRYCTLVLVMAPCFCRRWSRSWLLWRKCRLHFSHCGATGKERGCQMPWQGTRPRPQDTAPTIQADEGKSGNMVGGAAPAGTPSQLTAACTGFWDAPRAESLRR